MFTLAKITVSLNQQWFFSPFFFGDNHADAILYKSCVIQQENGVFSF